jgi:hypothetical protein
MGANVPRQPQAPRSHKVVRYESGSERGFARNRKAAAKGLHLGSPRSKCRFRGRAARLYTQRCDSGHCAHKRAALTLPVSVRSL